MQRSENDEGSSKSVTFTSAGESASTSSLTSAAVTSMEVTPPPHTLKRKASSTLSSLLRRLSRGWNSDDDEEEEAEAETPRSFSTRLQKVLRIIGLSSSSGLTSTGNDPPHSNGDDRPQLAPAEAGLAPAQPPRAVASLSQCSGIDVDDLAELSLDELVDKAFMPGSPHTRAPLTPHASTPRSLHTHPRPNPAVLARAQTLSVPLTRPSPSSRPCCSRRAASTSARRST